jgi:hypothetical protein
MNHQDSTPQLSSWLLCVTKDEISVVKRYSLKIAGPFCLHSSTICLATVHLKLSLEDPLLTPTESPNGTRSPMVLLSFSHSTLSPFRLRPPGTKRNQESGNFLKLTLEQYVPRSPSSIRPQMCFLECLDGDFFTYPAANELSLAYEQKSTGQQPCPPTRRYRHYQCNPVVHTGPLYTV